MKGIPILDPIEREGRFFCTVENCSHRYATKVGYRTLQGYQKHYKRVHHQSVRVGLISRIDLGSPGYREGLLDLAFKDFAREKVDFIILAGGLVSYKHLKGQLTKKALKKERTTKEELFEQWAEKLAKAIPQLRNEKGRLIKIYVTTSPASSFDSWLGAEVARRLAKKRRHDIFFWGEEDVRFPLKGLDREIKVLLPTKGAWRGKYYSTPAERILEDKQKQTTRSLPDLWVVGCLASGLSRPKGEMDRPYITVPALHILEEVKTSENQIGVRVVEFAPGNNIFLVRSHNFKDIAASERDGISDPKGASKLQRQIVAELKQRGPSSIGILEDALRVSRGKIEKAIKTLNESGYQPSVECGEASQLYSFSQSWVEEELRYTLPPLEELREDILIAFGCLHAASIFSEYSLFVNDVPKQILEYGATVLVGAGDLIEGLEHDLDKRGEVMAGWNYTQQERLAARMISSVILKVFKVRLHKALEGFKKRKPSAEELKAAVEESLLTFLYIPGNHCAWVKRKGVTPLATFGPTLVKQLINGIAETLGELGLYLPNLGRVVESKVIDGEVHQLP